MSFLDQGYHQVSSGMMLSSLEFQRGQQQLLLQEQNAAALLLLGMDGLVAAATASSGATKLPTSSSFLGGVVPSWGFAAQNQRYCHCTPVDFMRRGWVPTTMLRQSAQPGLFSSPSFFAASDALHLGNEFLLRPSSSLSGPSLESPTSADGNTSPKKREMMINSNDENLEKKKKQKTTQEGEEEEVKERLEKEEEGEINERCISGQKVLRSACDFCTKAKVKCNASKDAPCSNCTKHSIPCRFSYQLRRGPRPWSNSARALRRREKMKNAALVVE